MPRHALRSELAAKMADGWTGPGGRHVLGVEMPAGSGQRHALATEVDAIVPAADVLLDLNFDTLWPGNAGPEYGDAHQLTAVTTPTRSGTGSTGRFEIHNAATDQVSNGSYRSLLSKYDLEELGVAGQESIWGFSLQTPAVPAYEIVWELHQRQNIYNVAGSLSVSPHAILFREGTIQYRLMAGQAVWNGSAWTGWSNFQDQIVIRNSPQPNTWYDFIVHMRAAEDSTGFTRVYVRSSAEAWPASPTWENTGPTVQWVPGGLDPAVPTKRSVYDLAPDYRGLYLQAGLYNGSTTWVETQQQVIMFFQRIRKYGSVAAAKAAA